MNADYALGRVSQHRARSTGVVVGVMVLVAMFAGCDSEAPPASAENDKGAVAASVAERPNIVCIVVDALRADRLGSYGHPGKLTPTMDRWADEGVVFENCISAASWTLPSIATLFTGYYPAVHGVASYQRARSQDGDEVAEQSVLSDDFVTLSEVLERGGYQSAAFVGARFLDEVFGFAQGFDHYDSDLPVRPPASLINKTALAWLRTGRDPEQPFFLYLHYMDVHGPYDAMPRFLDPLVAKVEAAEQKTRLSDRTFARINRYLRKPPAETSDPSRYERLARFHEYWIARYEAGVAEMDFYLARLQEQLAAQGLWENTLVILTADHGEALGEYALWDHGRSLYAMELHVPLIMRWPGHLPAGERIAQRCGLVDVMPTLLACLELPAPATIQGVPLPLASLPETTTAIRFADATKGGIDHQNAVFAGNTQLLVARPLAAMQGTDGGRVKLLDVSDHRIRELRASPANTTTAGQLMAALKAHRESSAKLQPAALPKAKRVDPESIKALRALGYVGGEDPNDDGNAPAP